MRVEPWFVLAVIASFAGYAIYLAGLKTRLVEPNRASVADLGQRDRSRGDNLCRG